VRPHLLCVNFKITQFLPLYLRTCSYGFHRLQSMLVSESAIFLEESNLFQRFYNLPIKAYLLLHVPSGFNNIKTGTVGIS